MRLSLDIMSVDRASDEPMHRQIYGALRRFILDGQIQQNTLLPSTRSLAEDLKVGRNTVIAACDQLALEGYLAIRPRTPPLVMDLPSPAVAPRTPEWGAVAIDMPPGPFRGQALPDKNGRCERRGEYVINGGCWTVSVRRAPS